MESEIEKQSRQLGEAIAYLHFFRTNQVVIDEPDVSIDYIERLRSRYHHLKTKPNKSRSSLRIPEKECPIGKSFLNGNEDFFISYLLLSRDSASLAPNAERLTRHLNDCFWCFDFFVNVVRSFFHTVDILKKNTDNQ